MILRHRCQQPILVADDDDDDRLLTLDAFRDCGIEADIHFVENGEQLLEYLFRRGVYAAMKEHLLPSLILLDLNMPVLDGREALREIRSEGTLDTVPVVILTTSNSPSDIRFTFELGASLYITKPSSYKYLIRTVETLMKRDINKAPDNEWEFVLRVV